MLYNTIAYWAMHDETRETCTLKRFLVFPCNENARMIMITCINEEMAIQRFKCEMLPLKLLLFSHLVDCSLLFTKVSLKITKPVDSIIPYKYVAFYGFIIVWMIFIPPILKFPQQSQWFAPVLLLLLQLLLIKFICYPVSVFSKQSFSMCINESGVLYH